MDEQPRMPIDLQVVAIIFLLAGVGAVIEMLVALTRGGININFGVLGLFIGLGLYARQPAWRTCALVFTWIGMIGMPIIAYLSISGSAAWKVNVLGKHMGTISERTGLAVAAALCMFCFWQYCVLTRPGVRRLFVDEAAE